MARPRSAKPRLEKSTRPERSWTRRMWKLGIVPVTEIVCCIADEPAGAVEGQRSWIRLRSWNGGQHLSYAARIEIRNQQVPAGIERQVVRLFQRSSCRVGAPSPLKP